MRELKFLSMIILQISYSYICLVLLGFTGVVIRRTYFTFIKKKLMAFCQFYQLYIKQSISWNMVHILVGAWISPCTQTQGHCNTFDSLPLIVTFDSLPPIVTPSVLVTIPVIEEKKLIIFPLIRKY